MIQLQSTVRKNLPNVRGTYRFDYPLAGSVWFGVGGPAEIFFKPADAEDLSDFLKQKPADLPVLPIGVGSNLLVRDGGIDGVVIRLGRGFTDTEFYEDGLVYVGAAMLDQNLAKVCQQNGLGGLEFLSGIPGTIGGAVFMNAGAYGKEIKDVLVSVDVILPDGSHTILEAEEIPFTYRRSNLPEGAIVIGAAFQGQPEDPTLIQQRIDHIRQEREISQPVRAKTGGSTFKNPEGHKAWQLIDEAGGRGLTLGDAQVSEKHCNFLINTSNATARDLEALGEELRTRVKTNSDIDLQWEIQRVGEHILEEDAE